MNRTNTGANTDTEQILVDIFVMAIAFGIDLLLFKNMIGAGELPGLIIVVITFITINILANKGEYLYNVTLFNYLDRIHGKNLKSFILSSVITLLLLYLPVKTNRQSFRFYVIFLIIAYILGCVKMLIYRPFYDRIAKRDKPRTLFDDETAYFEAAAKIQNMFTGNTTIGTIITNAKLDKTALNKVASMAHNGYGRAIRPVHTMADGDSIYAVSVGSVPADINLVGPMSAYVMAKAIANAARSAKSVDGYKAFCDVNKK